MTATVETFGTSAEEHHVSILTKCNVNRVQAFKLMGLSDAELTAAVAQFEPIPNKSAMQAGLVAAAKAEITYRKEI